MTARRKKPAEPRPPKPMIFDPDHPAFAGLRPPKPVHNEKIDEAADERTLKEARDWLRKRVNGDVECPCCRRKAHVYRRPLSAGMVRWLMEFYRRSRAIGGRHRWVFAVRLLVNNAEREYARLARWGLLERKGWPSGYWRETELGTRFVERRATVYSHEVEYGGHVMRLDGDPNWTIDDALGKKFDYEELMAERPETDVPR